MRYVWEMWNMNTNYIGHRSRYRIEQCRAMRSLTVGSIVHPSLDSSHSRRWLKREERCAILYLKKRLLAKRWSRRFTSVLPCWMWSIHLWRESEELVFSGHKQLPDHWMLYGRNQSCETTRNDIFVALIYLATQKLAGVNENVDLI